MKTAQQIRQEIIGECVEWLRVNPEMASTNKHKIIMDCKTRLEVIIDPTKQELAMELVEINHQLIQTRGALYRFSWKFSNAKDDGRSYEPADESRMKIEDALSELMEKTLFSKFDRDQCDPSPPSTTEQEVKTFFENHHIELGAMTGLTC